VIAFDRFIFGYSIGVLEIAGALLVVASCVAHARVTAPRRPPG
jgi:hypothetical protein